MASKDIVEEEVKTGRQKKLESLEVYRLMFVIPRNIGGEDVMEKTFRDVVEGMAYRTRFGNFNPV